jgi:hypothetical protein
MVRRMLVVGLAVALVAATLPAPVFAEDSHPLASLKTSEGLQKALKAAGQVQLQEQPQGGSGTPFFKTPKGKLTLGLAVLAASAAIVAVVWHGPDPTRADQ